MSSSPIHRVAVVGCGMLAQSVHLPNIQNNPRLHLAVTCDQSPAVAEACRQRFAAERAETDWRKVIDAPDVDFIVLATHTNLRGELIIPALKAGKPVYTEKPLSASRSEMKQIIRAARGTRIPVCVGHNRRSSPAVLELKRLVEKARQSTTVARPSVDRAHQRRPLPEQTQTMMMMRINDDVRSWKDWVFWDEEGIIFGEMVHFIDLALWLHPLPPIRVFAEGSARGNFVMVLTFADGSIATFHHTFVGNFDYPKELIEVTLNQVTVAMDHHLEIRQCGLLDEPIRKVFPFESAPNQREGLGSSGYFEALEKERLTILKEGRDARWLNVIKGHARHLDLFALHLEGKGPNPCDVESSVPVNRLALKFLESVRAGSPIKIGPEDWHLPEENG